MDYTPNPELKAARWKILLSAFSSLNDPGPSIAREPYQLPSSALFFIAFLTIAKSEHEKPLLRMISCPQSYGANPCATASISFLSDFM